MTDRTSTDIVNVVICYNNVEEVIQYWENIKKMELHQSVALVIVVNKEESEEKIRLKEYAANQEGKVSVVLPEENLGYMNGLIYGYNAYRKAGDEIPKYVIMSNTDIVYEDIRFFEKLLSREYEDDVWCIGPSVVNRFDSYDNPVCDERRSLKEINSLILRFSIPLFGPLYVKIAGIKSKYVKRKKEESRYVYEVHGCHFILTRDFAEYIRDQWYGTLLYSEETFIAEHVYKNHKKIYYDSDLEVRHVEHSVTGKVQVTRHCRYLKESMECIRKTFY